MEKPTSLAERINDGEFSVVLFDGVCNLCDHSVRLIFRNDPRGAFRFAPLQGDVAAILLGKSPIGDPDSIVLVDKDGVWERSDAALRIASRMAWPFKILAVGRILPRFARDSVYRFIARNRYRWFGKKESCSLPPKGLAARFLEMSRDDEEPLSPEAQPTEPAVR